MYAIRTHTLKQKKTPKMDFSRFMNIKLSMSHFVYIVYVSLCIGP